MNFIIWNSPGRGFALNCGGQAPAGGGGLCEESIHGQSRTRKCEDYVQCATQKKDKVKMG
jgi:hypothetical protein